MARVLKTWPVEKKQKGKSKYTKYLDGQVWRVTLRDVGGIQMKNVRSIITRQGKAEGKLVHFAQLDATTFVVRAEPRQP